MPGIAPTSRPPSRPPKIPFPSHSFLFSPYSKKRKRSAIAKNIENIPDYNIEKFAKSIIPKKRRPSLILFIVGAGLSLFSLAIFIFTIYLYFEDKTLDSTDIAGLIMYPILIACGIVGMRVGGWSYTHFRLQGFTCRNKPFKSTHLQYDEILGYTYVQEPKEKTITKPYPYSLGNSRGLTQA